MLETDRRGLLGGAAALVFGGLGARAARAAENVTFVGWSQDEAFSKPVLTGLFDRYRAAHPGTSLETIGFPWAQMQQNLILRMRSGQALDVAQMQERWLPSFARLGNLTDMAELLGKERLAERIDPGLLRLGQIGGRQVGLPWTAASIGFVGNKRVLDEAAVAQPPATIAELETVLAAVKKAKPDAVPLALCTKNNASISVDFQIFLWTFGGRLLDDAGNVTVKSPQAVEALAFLSGLVKSGHIAKDIDRPDSRRLFGQFQTAFYFDPPLARGFARDNSGMGKAVDPLVLALPTPVLKAGDPPKAVMWGHLLVMPVVGGKRPARDGAATKLVEFFSLDDASQLAYYEAVALFPVTRTALATLAGDPYVINWTKVAGTAERDEPSNWSNAADLTTIIGEEAQGAYLATKTPAAAIDSMAMRLEQKMKDVRGKG